MLLRRIVSFPDMPDYRLAYEIDFVGFGGPIASFTNILHPISIHRTIVAQEGLDDMGEDERRGLLSSLIEIS